MSHGLSPSGPKTLASKSLTKRATALARAGGYKTEGPRLAKEGIHDFLPYYLVSCLIASFINSHDLGQSQFDRNFHCRNAELDVFLCKVLP